VSSCQLVAAHPASKWAWGCFKRGRGQRLNSARLGASLARQSEPIWLEWQLGLSLGLLG